MIPAVVYLSGWAASLLVFPPPPPTRADEPLAPRWSWERAAAFLDSAAVDWSRSRRCVSCHTTMPYLLARPLLPGEGGLPLVRDYLERSVRSWATAARPPRAGLVIPTAFALAAHDAATTGTLHETTRAALDQMWQLQRDSGDWDWLKCDWPPLEHDDYYGATVAALAVGYAPGDYARTPAARAGLARLIGYFRRNPPPDLHHAAMLLWASTRLDGLLTAPDRERILTALKAKQRPDGGWNLPSLGTYERRDGTPNDPDAPSDGYATGLVTFVLLQAGLKPTDPAVADALRWLRTHQRVGGRWYTRSVNNDKAHYIANAGTAFAVLALHAAGDRPGADRPPPPSPAPRR